MIAYLYDASLHQEINAQERNHWDVYLHEICNQLGVTANQISLAEMADSSVYDGVRTLIVGSQSGKHLSTPTLANVRRWVEDGGILIAFNLEGLDDVFGIETEARLSQPVDDYTIAAYFEFQPHHLTREIHPFMLIEQRLFALSDISLVKLAGAVELARLYDTSHTDLGRPAITWRQYGEGFAAYFAFDVAQSIWLLHQGRPLPMIPEGQWAMRTPQLQVLGDNSHKVAYADELVHLLQNMMAPTHQPFLYPIPPDNGKVPDALLYYSGDDYTGPVEQSLQASDFMASRCLPYHINIAAHLHPMTRQEFEHIRANGHEVSCYMWIWTDDKQGSVISRHRFAMQAEQLQQRFGILPGSVLVGSCQWQGWAEPARWLAEVGATADNTFIGHKATTAGARCDGKHGYVTRWYNGPFYGYGFGTSFPFFFYENWGRGNARIPLQEQPIVCYELGHRASNLVDEANEEREVETFSPEDVHEPIDRAIRYHLVMNMFYHPAYIVGFPHCRLAIDEIKRYIAYREAHVLHMANNAVADWWNARADTRITDVTVTSGAISFVADSTWKSGVIVKLQLDADLIGCITCDGEPMYHEMKREFGSQWLYLVVPTGHHQVHITLCPSISRNVNET